MERTTTRPGTELKNVVNTTFLKSEQARITRKFNQKLKRIYRQEPNLAERLRILKQRRAELNMLVKKTALCSHLEHIITLFDIEIEITQTIIRDTGQLYSAESPGFASPFKWSATVADLIELIYALITARCINDGNIPIADIVVFFEKMFNIKLGRFYIKFAQLRERKKERAVFLKRLYDLLIDRMNSLDN